MDSLAGIEFGDMSVLNLMYVWIVVGKGYL